MLACSARRLTECGPSGYTRMSGRVAGSITLAMAIIYQNIVRSHSAAESRREPFTRRGSRRLRLLADSFEHVHLQQVKGRIRA